MSRYNFNSWNCYYIIIIPRIKIMSRHKRNIVLLLFDNNFNLLTAIIIFLWTIFWEFIKLLLCY